MMKTMEKDMDTGSKVDEVKDLVLQSCTGARECWEGLICDHHVEGRGRGV